MKRPPRHRVGSWRGWSSVPGGSSPFLPGATTGQSPAPRLGPARAQPGAAGAWKHPPPAPRSGFDRRTGALTGFEQFVRDPHERTGPYRERVAGARAATNTGTPVFPESEEPGDSPGCRGRPRSRQSSAAARRYAPEMPEIGPNPFQPGRGILPPLLAGRDPELGAADEALAQLTEGRSPSQDLLFYGPRGNGKTTILLEVERRARERGFRVEALSPPGLDGVEHLVHDLQERTGQLQGQVTGSQVAGVGATGVPTAPTEDVAQLLVSWIDADARPLVIVLDEVQMLPPEVGRSLFDAVQSAKSRAAPFVVLAAGTPDAPWRLLQAGSHNERGFEFLRVSRLARQDTNAALSVPARKARRPIEEGALALLAEESQDYPYFVQLLGSLAWDAAAESDSPIDHSAAHQGLAEFGAQVEDFYERRYQEARAHRIAPALKPLAQGFADGDGRLSQSRLESLLQALSREGVVPFDDIALEQELSDLGVVWSVRPGVWEMGIPRFADYVIRRG